MWGGTARHCVSRRAVPALHGAFNHGSTRRVRLGGRVSRGPPYIWPGYNHAIPAKRVRLGGRLGGRVSRGPPYILARLQPCDPPRNASAKADPTRLFQRGVRPRPFQAATQRHCPSGGCQSSTLLPSGSMTHPNFPYSESSVVSSTSQPSSRSPVGSALADAFLGGRGVSGSLDHAPIPEKRPASGAAKQRFGDSQVNR
jgi:hypothetical protein